MKTLITLLALNIAIIATGYCNDKLKDIKARVGNTEILKNWKVGEVKETNGILITRISGENTYYAHTNILYTPYAQIQGTIEAKATVENLSENHKWYLEDGFEDCCAGGQISLFLDRELENLADASLFKLTVMNSDETEAVYQKMLLKEAPRYYVQGVWHNFKTIDIPCNLEKNFVVKIEDNGLNQVYKFRVGNSDIPKIVPNDIPSIMSSK